MARENTTSVDERLDEIADELYAAPPDEFVPRRDERARELTAAGERKLAAEVRKLRKPTVSAWAVNQLVRSRGDEVEAFVALGPALADAQRDLDGEAMRSLSVQRQRLVQALVQNARELAAEAGHPIGTSAAYEVETTLHAGLADPEVAQRVLSGRLVKPESYAGFGPFGGAPPLRLVEPGQAEPETEPAPAPAAAAKLPAAKAPTAAPPRPTAAPKGPTAPPDTPALETAAAAPGKAAARAAERREQLRQEREQARRERDQTARRAAERKAAEQRRLERSVEEARTALVEAETALAEASADADAAEGTRGELREQATHLREQLADVERRIAETDLDRRRLRQVTERAKARVARAAQQVEAAQRRLTRHTP